MGKNLKKPIDIFRPSRLENLFRKVHQKCPSFMHETLKGWRGTDNAEIYKSIVYCLTIITVDDIQWILGRNLSR